MPKESLLEFQAWKASEKKREALLAGLPLPPDEDAATATPLLEAPPPPQAAAAPPEEASPAAAAPRPRRRCPFRTEGVTAAEFLDRLHKGAATIDWGEDVCGALVARARAVAAAAPGDA